MISSYTLKTVPFKILRPTLHTLMGATLMVFGQTWDREWTNEALALRILALRDKTAALQNPTRHNLVTVLTAWYGTALELCDTVQSTYPELAALLRNVVKEAGWIEPAWLYMKGQMDAWQTNSTQ